MLTGNSEPGGLNQSNPVPARFDGTESVLYWADVCSELAIVIPSKLGGVEEESAGGQDQKVVLIWVESLEDADLVPLASLVPGINTVCLVIFLQPLASGLIRVKLAGHVGKMNLATPLVDGMVVSRRALGPLVRQTALNMCR